MTSAGQALGLIPLVALQVPNVAPKSNGGSRCCRAFDAPGEKLPPFLIRLGDGSGPSLVIGRVALLGSLRAACFWDGSGKGLHRRYREAHRWGIRSLSRRLLRFSGSGVQARGEHAIVRLNGTEVLPATRPGDAAGSGNGSGNSNSNGNGNGNSNGNGIKEWGTPAVAIEAGDVLSLEPRGGQGLLEFRVVALSEETGNEHGSASGNEKHPASNETGEATVPKASGTNRDEKGNDHSERGQKRQRCEHVPNPPRDTVDSYQFSDSGNRKTTVGNSPRTRSPEKLFVVHFFPFGSGFSASRRQKLERNFELLGATVTDDLWRANHIVISDTVRSLELVAKRLRVSEEELRQHLEKNPHIRCAMPSWADHCIATAKCLQIPSRIHLWCHGATPMSVVHGTRTSTTNKESFKRKRDAGATTDEPPIEKKTGGSDNKIEHTRRRIPFPRNVQVSNAFEVLGRLHQSMPLLPGDQWKSYCFRIVAGRLLELDFEVSSDDEIQRRLKSIKGFGNSVCEKIQECINHGTITRIEEFESDEQRQAMKKITDIWGVGPVKARELIALGYKTIDEVRDAVCRNQISLQRNQLVGVDCYEDILDRMPRSEVEKLCEVVRRVAEKLFPGMEASIMGSYRRGKDDCGDVDILLCHPDHVDTIPTSGLGQIIDALWNEGKVAMHLTNLVGMTTGYHYTDYEKASRYVPKAVWEEAVKQSKHTEYDFYMGCLYSPSNPRVRRRVDIKFYPYRERAFAMLYFTGNGYFNRSMRLWATRVFNYKLTDHGLFDRDDGTTRVFEASTEREVFDHLGLVYREPNERHHWDALEPLDRDQKPDLTLNASEFKQDKEHKWVD